MIQSMLSADVISRLPTPKGVALALTKACQREEVHLNTITGLIRTDPALSGRVLGLANSSVAGGRSLASLDDAVSRLGTSTVSQVALAFSLIDQYSEGHCTNFNYVGFWNQSLLMAAASQQLGTLRNLGPANELFTVGLLAQIGKLALATAFPKDYSNVIAVDMNPMERLKLEDSQFGINHINLSIALIEHWGISHDYARPFGMYEVGPAEIFVPYVRQKERALLSHAAWVIAKELTNGEIDNLFEDDQCIEALAWLELNREEMQVQLAAVELVWLNWLQLVARES